MPKPFEFAATPHLYFGVGKRAVLLPILSSYGPRVLLVTGSRSFLESQTGKELLNSFGKEISVDHFTVPSEPTPQMIDEAVSSFSSSAHSVVLAIGGGSVLDAGKAISAMIPLKSSVKEYLEGVGTKTHPGVKVPFIAVPTTAGTGSEATRNAVISEVGEHGFKRSLRHNRFVPDVAVVDPELTLSCPPAVTAASGMDAFTQLLESYLSTNANPLSDVLAAEGLSRIARALIKTYHEPADLQARTDMAFAAYLSGVALANAGLGLVHGFASSIGGAYPIAHGTICSSTMYAANVVTVRKLRKQKEAGMLSKVASAGQIVASTQGESQDYYIDYLLDFILRCRTELNIPRLSIAGVEAGVVTRIALHTDNKYNPVPLNAEEREEVLRMSL